MTLERLVTLKPSRVAWVGAGLVWLLAIAGGLGAMVWYESIPAPSQPIATEWPAGSRIAPSPGQATLVLFAHPKCPCTRASLGELEKIVARAGQNLDVWVAFFQPAGAEDDWAQTDLWRTAAAIPGVHVICDQAGAEARRFAATTSGQALVYDARGRLLFGGGITVARGHAGDNRGAEAIEMISRGEVPEVGETPVFGCSIVPAGQTK
jgi:hypothetical protein